MKYPHSLRELWWQRATEKPAWWTQRYNDALARIEDCTDKEDPYWYSPATEYDTTQNDGMVNDPFGGHITPDEARQQAFDLLVLADLGDVAAASRDSLAPKEGTDG